MKITSQSAEHIYHTAIKNGEITDENAVIFYSKKMLAHRLQLLKDNFPSSSLHAIAIKTCNHPEVLKYIAHMGFGLEAASIEEVKLAKSAGVENAKIVFDSPVKTSKEIQYCHEHLQGILLNANSLEELNRYPKDFSGKLGLRINPLAQISVSKHLNVSQKTSKFGVPISNHEAILKACLLHSNIKCLHMHIGSTIKDFSSNLIAINKLVVLAKEINALRKKANINTKINTIDIGGGIDFDLNDGGHTVKAFTKKLNEIAHINEFGLITEFGAFVHADCSFVVSNIEYVIENEKELPSTAFLHVGADLFLRKIYSSLDIKYPYSIIRKDKKPNRTEKTYNIVGPLCFAGDVLYENIKLEEITEDDKFIIYNIGANTYSMWSNHCSRDKTCFKMVD